MDIPVARNEWSEIEEGSPAGLQLRLTAAQTLRFRARWPCPRAWGYAIAHLEQRHPHARLEARCDVGAQVLARLVMGGDAPPRRRCARRHPGYPTGKAGAVMLPFHRPQSPPLARQFGCGSPALRPRCGSNFGALPGGGFGRQLGAAKGRGHGGMPVPKLCVGLTGVMSRIAAAGRGSKGLSRCLT